MSICRDPVNGRGDRRSGVPPPPGSTPSSPRDATSGVSGMPSDTPRRIVVVGNGMVGHRFVEAAIVDRGLAADARVVVFGDEPIPAYDRVAA